jgi:FlaA1/EpsC-like NDP-sugar epimerase
MELHPDESVKTNVFGTNNLAEAADRVGTDVFIMLSTDKAVNPSSVMGATKRLAELILQQMNSISDTCICSCSVWQCFGEQWQCRTYF